MKHKPGPDLPMNDDEVVPYTRDFEHTFFEGAGQITVEVTMMQDTWEDIQALLERNGWAQNEGLLMLLGTGLAYLRAEQALTITGGAAGLREAEIRKLLDRLLEIEARFAAMKNFTFWMMRDHQAMELKYVAIERLGVGHQRLAERLRAENQALKAEVERLSREVEALRPVAPRPAPQKRSRWQRILAILREPSVSAD